MDTSPNSDREYRLTTVLLYVPGAAVILLLPLSASVLCDALNRHDVARIESAVAVFCFSVAISLLFAWFMLMSLRYRLFVSGDAVRSTTVFRTAEIRLADVDRVTWDHRGCVTIRSAATKIRISVDGGWTRRTEMISTLREKLADRANDGWERFEQRFLGPPDWDKQIARCRRDLRSVTILWCFGLPLMYVIIFGEAYLGFLPGRNLLALAIFPALIPAMFVGGAWYCLRAAQAAARKAREEASSNRG